MTRAEDRARRRSSRPPLSDPELQQRMIEAEDEKLPMLAQLDALAERMDRVTRAMDRAPTNGIVTEPLSDEDSLIQHVEAVRTVVKVNP